MMVRWMCRVLLKDRKRSLDLYSFLGVECGGCGAYPNHLDLPRLTTGETWQIEVVWVSGA